MRSQRSTAPSYPNPGEVLFALRGWVARAQPEGRCGIVSVAMKLTVILAPEGGGRYSVICPAVPGCVSQGDSLEEALVNIREAILLCLDVRRADGLPSPAETPEIIALEIRECLEDRAEEGLPLTIETREVDLEVEVAV